jgi:hypothetical protein
MHTADDQPPLEGLRHEPTWASEAAAAFRSAGAFVRKSFAMGRPSVGSHVGRELSGQEVSIQRLPARLRREH